MKYQGKYLTLFNCCLDFYTSRRVCRIWAASIPPAIIKNIKLYRRLTWLTGSYSVINYYKEYHNVR